MRNVVGQVVVLAGCLLALLAGIGMLRLPDVLARMHALSKVSTLGFVLVMIGAAACMSTSRGMTALLLAAALQCFTLPVGANLIGRATYRARALAGEGEEIDELAAEELADREPDGADGEG